MIMQDFNYINWEGGGGRNSTRLENIHLSIPNNHNVLPTFSGNPRRHIEVFKSLRDKPCGGEPSLQNSLELVIQTLKNMPAHTSRYYCFIGIGR